MDDQEKGEPVTSCMGVFKAKILSDDDESLHKIKLIIVGRGDMQNK